MHSCIRRAQGGNVTDAVLTKTTSVYKMPKAGEEGKSFVERGRLRYQEKDYVGALEAFTEAVAQSTGSLLLVALDHRAATHEKLWDFKNALRDSKKMIEEKPDASKVC